jgi:hypothetical protein
MVDRRGVGEIGIGLSMDEDAIGLVGDGACMSKAGFRPFGEGGATFYRQYRTT